MNGCRYLVITHDRQRRGKGGKGELALRRGRAMCLAVGEEMIPCQVPAKERGAKCVIYQAKLASRTKEVAMDISNTGAGPRCTVCEGIAIYEHVTVVSTRIYLLNQEGERGRLLTERQPRTSVSYTCPQHGRPFGAAGGR
jgi:hypothetical protein